MEKKVSIWSVYSNLKTEAFYPDEVKGVGGNGRTRARDIWGNRQLAAIVMRGDRGLGCRSDLGTAQYELTVQAQVHYTARPGAGELASSH